VRSALIIVVLLDGISYALVGKQRITRTPTFGRRGRRSAHQVDSLPETTRKASNLLRNRLPLPLSSLPSPLPSPPLLDKLWGLTSLQSAENGNLTLSLTQSIDVPTPSFVQILAEGVLTITSFSMLRKGSIFKFNYRDNSGNDGGPSDGTESGSNEVAGTYLWPNELNVFEDAGGRSVLLVADGFILPGQNDGGLYAIRDPQRGAGAQVQRITEHKAGWFYHRAVHVHLPGGRDGILTARATKPLWGKGRGELVWLTQPDAFSAGTSGSGGDDAVGAEAAPEAGWGARMMRFLRRGPASLSLQRRAAYAPWQETVLAEGPDVMFEVLDLDKSDDRLEVVSAQFFDEQIIVHSLRATDRPPYVEATALGTVPTVGRPYGLCLMSLPSRDNDDDDGSTDVEESAVTSAAARSAVKSAGGPRFPPGQRPRRADACHVDNASPTHLLVSTHECSYDMHVNKLALGAIGDMFPRIVAGAALPYRGHEPVHRQDANRAAAPNVEGGSLFAYELPRAPPTVPSASSPSPSSSSLSLPVPSLSWPRTSLFRGFKVSSWWAFFSPGAPGFPYVFKMPGAPRGPPLILLSGDCTGSAYIFAPRDGDSGGASRGSSVPTYDMAFEIQCGATVGSAAAAAALDGSGGVDIFIPSYELNKIHKFRLAASAAADGEEGVRVETTSPAEEE